MVFAQQGQQRPQCTLLENVVPTLRAITSDVTQSPYGLLADIKYGRREEIDKLRDSVCLDHNLSVFSSSGGNVG
jgi:hypothetical protein